MMSECNAILMSQNTQGEAGIVLVRPPFSLREVVVKAQNQLRMSEDIMLFNILGSLK